jgi:hypothetical protein
MGEVHRGGDGLHWTAVPSEKWEKEEEKEEKEKKTVEGFKPCSGNHRSGSHLISITIN